MFIITITPLSVGDLQKIRDILIQSHCPNESLRNTFDNFTALTDKEIIFDDALNRDEHRIIYKI